MGQFLAKDNRPTALRHIKYLCRHTYDDNSCVYFLVEREEVVYVGQTNNLHVRIRQHRRENSKTFDYVAYVSMAADIAKATESALIRYLCPKYNGKCTGGIKYNTPVMDPRNDRANLKRIGIII